jgi:hypothetical protein
MDRERLVESAASDAARLLLAARVRRLWALAGVDLRRACQEFDLLVAEHGRVRMGVALSDAAELDSSGAIDGTVEAGEP